MNFSFDPRRDFAAEFKRIADEQLAAAQHSLVNEPAPEAIHNARKRFKRVRALYRLAARHAGTFRATENARLRDVARTLSRDRDAVVLVETAAYLGHDAGSAPRRNAMKRIEDHLAMRRHETAAADDEPAERIAAAVETCNAARKAIADATFPSGRKTSARHLARAWEKLLVKADAALEACRETDNAERMHDLRKRCQDYRFFADLLHGAWPSALLAKRQLAKKLADDLGRHHDLSVLEHLVDTSPNAVGTEEDLRVLKALLAAAKRKLRDKSLKAAEKLFAETPEQEARIIHALWKTAGKHVD